MKQQATNKEDFTLFLLGCDTRQLLEIGPISDQELHDSPIIVLYKHAKAKHASQFEHASTHEQLVIKEIPNHETLAHMYIRTPMDPPKVAKSFEQPCTCITSLPQI